MPTRTFPVLELVRFRLVPGTDSTAFLAAARGTSDLLAGTPGFRRRLLACDDAGLWTDAVEWDSAEAAHAAAETLMAAPEFQPMMALLDAGSVVMSHQSILLQAGG